MAPSAVNNDLENFDVDDFNDPFTSGDENTKTNSQSKKRDADASGLGIEEAVAVHKKPRAPRVKLDENRLLSNNGLPKLRRKGRELKFKGKGHEYSDTERLLTFYQLWLDDLFPKGKFLDSLTMIEKAGHKQRVVKARLDWIEEGRPKGHAASSPMPEETREPAKSPAKVAPIIENQARTSRRPRTPSILDDELFDDPEGIYDATPRAPRTAPPGMDSLFGIRGSSQNNDVPDEDDLDALMAEEEAQRSAPTSLFGNGKSAEKPAQRQAEPDEDEFDTLMAEAEVQQDASNPAFGNGGYTQKQEQHQGEPDEDELDAMMAEAEIEPLMSKDPPAKLSKVAMEDNEGLDYLMAEMETKTYDTMDSAKKHEMPKADEASGTGKRADADDEEAMAEMDGLW